MDEVQDAKTFVPPATSARAGLPAALCEAATSLLPLAERERHIKEWQSALDADPDHALRYAINVLVSALPLPRTFPGSLHLKQPVLCQLRRHRYVTVHDNPENLRFTSRHCLRCGHIKDNWRGRGSTLGESVAWTLSRS